MTTINRVFIYFIEGYFHTKYKFQHKHLALLYAGKKRVATKKLGCSEH